MGCGMPTKGWLCSTGSATFLWTLFACKRPMSHHPFSAILGFPHMDFCPLSPLALYTPVVLSFFTGQIPEFLRHDVTFRVACIYAPNRNPDRDAFFNFVSSQIDLSSATLVCGDFNAVFDRSMDRRGSNPLDSSRESSSALLSLFRDCGVIDIWRSLHPATVAFSWLRPDGTLSSRIDFIGCPYAWIHLVQSCDMLACPFSDHCAVLLSVPIPEPTPRGPGHWKFNVSTLRDAGFRSSVSDFWAGWRTRKQSFDSLQL